MDRLLGKREGSGNMLMMVPTKPHRLSSTLVSVVVVVFVYLLNRQFPFPSTVGVMLVHFSGCIVVAEGLPLQHIFVHDP